MAPLTTAPGKEGDGRDTQTGERHVTSQTERQRLRRRLERLIGIAATEGNELVPLRNGDEIFPAMLDAIRTARHTIGMMTFVYWRGDIAHAFAQALSGRARAGVRVRLLLDGFGAKEIEPQLLDAMAGAGVRVAWFRKPTRLSPMRQNHRCHRKVLVTGEHTAFTGGVGIAREWCGNARDPHEWRDTHVQVRGPAVDGIAAAFAQSWAECHDELYDEHDRFTSQEQPGSATVQVVRGSAGFGWQDMQTLLRVVITSARQRQRQRLRLRLSTAYFRPRHLLHRPAGRRRPPRREGGDPPARPPHRPARLPPGRPAALRPSSTPASTSATTSRPCSTPRSSPWTGSAP
ncbi:hypothetical protein GCM10009601_63130 [Streptomyces thermospinosisporus]|uniref:Phospholipase D-like domain-containing protein n=1 Tax=Streptomyces thermospinosisporus TaxID=161482 RepID=A0ABN1Z7Q0_9ACTN